jgi:hypothetical protein
MFSLRRQSGCCGCQQQFVELTQRLATIEAGLAILAEGMTGSLVTALSDSTAEPNIKPDAKACVPHLANDSAAAEHPALTPTLVALPTVPESIRSFAAELRALHQELEGTRLDLAA